MANQDANIVTKIEKIKSDLEILKKRKKALDDKEEKLFQSKKPSAPRMSKISTSNKQSQPSDSFDPEQLVLTKDDVIAFCDRILEKWNKESSKNLNQIFAMNAVRTSVFWTDDESLKAIWKEILLWMYDLLYENAKAHGNKSSYGWTKTLSKIKK